MTGDELRRARERLGLTQTQLGKRLDLSRNTIGAYEASARVPAVVELAVKELLRARRRKRPA